MLFKLLKYDFRAMWKQFSLVWGAALVLALSNRFALFRGMGKTLITNSGLFAFAVCCVIMAMFIISISFVIDRFSKGLLGNEGYLMHTLPVRPWELVLSKLVCGTVTWIISGLVAFGALFFMVDTDWSFFFDFELWNNIFRGLSQNPDVLLMMLELGVMLIAAIFLSIAVIYLAASIGHLCSRHHRLASVAAFIGLYIIQVNFYARFFSWGPAQSLIDWVNSNVHGAMFTVTVSMLVPAALFLAAVCWILEHKLNLE